MDWPSNSSDLNLIENVFAEMEKRVAKAKPTSKQSLREAVEAAVHQLERAQLVIQNGGLPIDF